MSELQAIRALLFDTGGVLYHRPRQNRHLKAFLETHGLRLRHPAVLEKGLRAARFDAQTGRISRETFYDGILRINGLQDERLFPAGREAIYRDAVDIELFPGVAEVLSALYEAGVLLGAVSDTSHRAEEKIAWMAARGVPPEVWAVFLVSADVGVTKAEPLIFEHALAALELPPAQVAYVGHATGELISAHEAGLVTVAFLPDDYSVEADWAVGSFYELAELVLG